MKPYMRGIAALALLGTLAAAGCGHSGNAADKDRPAVPPVDAIAQIQNNPAMTPQQKQMAINAVTVARTRASGQMSVGAKKDIGM